MTAKVPLGDKTLKPHERKRVYAIRRANLQRLLKWWRDRPVGGNDTSFARRVTIPATMISNYKNEKSTRNMGDSIAAKIEVALGLPGCSLDDSGFVPESALALQAQANELASKWMSLPPEARQLVAERIDTLMDARKNAVDLMAH